MFLRDSNIIIITIIMLALLIDVINVSFVALLLIDTIRSDQSEKYLFNALISFIHNTILY